MKAKQLLRVSLAWLFMTLFIIQASYGWITYTANVELKLGEKQTVTVKYGDNHKYLDWTFLGYEYIAECKVQGNSIVVTGKNVGTTKCECEVYYYTSTGTKISTTCTINITVTADPPKSISLDKTNTVLQVGESERLTATILPTTAKQSVSWDVLDAGFNVVSVSDGVVKAKAVGTAVVRATSTENSSLFKDCIVTVKEWPTSVSLNKTSLDLEIGETEQLSATVLPEGASQDIEWQIESGSQVASVSASGLVSALGVGTTVIIAQSKVNSSVYKECVVKVSEPKLRPGILTGNTVAIGDYATKSTNMEPYYNYGKYSSVQMLYTPTEIGKSGKITGISFKVATAEPLATSRVRVYLGHKSGTFSSTSSYVSSGSLTLVYVGTPTLGQIVGWEKLLFNQGDFTYNGTDNLVVVVTKEAPAVSQSLEYFSYIGIGYTLYRGSNSNADIANVSNTSNSYSASQNRPAIKLEFEAVTPTSISLNRSTLNMEKDETAQLTATILPLEASQSVDWTSNNTNVATVVDGKVTAKNYGTAIVTATASENPDIKTECIVTVTSEPIPPTPEEDTDISRMDNVIHLERIEARAGSTATLSFKMKNSAAIRGFQFDLYLPEGVTPVKNAKGRIQGSLSSGRLPEDDEHTLTISEQADGSIRFLCGSQYDETFEGSNGEIATLQVKIIEDLADGDYPIILKDMRLSESDINLFYDTQRIKSSITITSITPGDINGDGVVNVSDYIGIANHILGNTPEGFIEKAGDVNEDNVINVSDYIGVANFILAGSFYGASNVKAAHMPAKATNLNAQENVIYVEPMEADPGTQVTLSLQMKNSAAIRGFQFDLYLPEGVTAVKNAKGRIQGSLSSGRLPEDDEHTLTIQAQNDGAIRFLCGSQYDETFIGASGEIATLQVNIAEGMTSGEYPIVLKNMRLSETDISKYYDTDNVETVLTVRGEEPTPEWHDGDVFTAQTVEGVDMIFQVISAKDKTCGVGKEDDFDASIDPDYNGKVTIPSMIKGLYVTKIHFCAFSYCDITSVSIPEGITDINAYAFADCNSLSSIQLPESLERIEREALRGTAITSLTIPANVSFIEDTYEGMSENLVGLTENLESIVVDSRNNYYDSRNNCNAIIETATNRLISGCQKTIIPEDVESIEGYAFWGCSYLPSISIPKKVKSIGDLAFSWCTSLKSVILSEGLESIGTYAFSHSDIKEITIPSTVTSLGSGIVSNCANLETITSCIVRPTDIDDKVFGADLGHEPVYDKVILYVPDGSISLYKKAEGWKNFYDIRTGIKAIYSNGQDHNTIYTLSGHEIQVPQRGVNIIRSADGTTRKVLVK